MHYTRWRNHGDPNVLIRPQKYAADARCYGDGCTEPPRSKGLCELHYDRFRATGDPDVVLRDVRPAAERWKDYYTATDLGYKTPCWPWTGRISVYGYGRIKNRRNHGGVQDPMAHRFVYEQVVGPIPEGMTLDHLCHNADQSCNDGTGCIHRRCVNPDHLEPATRRANTFSGRTPAAANAAKTHCKWGHEFTPENTGVEKSGKRYCRACGARRQAEYRAKQRK